MDNPFTLFPCKVCNATCAFRATCITLLSEAGQLAMLKATLHLHAATNTPEHDYTARPIPAMLDV